jgi:hypothetical protein
MGVMIRSNDLGINPIRLYGPWDEGYALDFHQKPVSILQSILQLSCNYETEYTKLGKLLHHLKYRN